MAADLLRPRFGIPRFARKVVAGEPATIVAFGTSLTLHTRCAMRLGGRYLDVLLRLLQDATGNSRIELVYNGLEGFSSWWGVHRVRSDVLPRKPDLVILEFAHNDLEQFTAAVPLAMNGIIAQVRAAFPLCEFVDVLLAPQGTAAGGPNPGMLVHERLDDYFGFPSFDLASLAERLVAEGRASWNDADASALTFDGVHHTALATELLGVPFAQAFVELIRTSVLSSEAALPALLPLPVARADRASLGPFLDERWTVEAPPDEIHCCRNAAAYDDAIVTARAEGAVFRCTFEGDSLQVWALCLGGALRVDIDSETRDLEIPALDGYVWQLVDLGLGLPYAPHRVEATVIGTPVVLGDLFFTGEVST